jgi:hypothetical protein
MKYYLLLTLFVFTIRAVAQPKDTTLKKVVDEVLEKSEELSLYKDSVNWLDVRKTVYKQSKKATSIEELKPAFEFLMNVLRDHHGRIISATDYSIIAHFTDSPNIRYKDERAIDTEIWNSVQDANARFEFELLDGNVGYLKVVGVGPNIDGQAEAERIRKAIYSLNNKNVTEWILDLRYNGGGNSNVMLAGLAPLLNTSQIASIQNLNGTVLGRAEIIEGNYSYFGYEAFSIADSKPIASPKIAVLTSRYTVSSGELVAVAFKGQEQVRFFGEATGGYTTNTSAELIQDAIYLVIATGIFADRHGRAYPENIPTDVNINFEIETDKLKDAGIIAAKAWLIKD